MCHAQVQHVKKLLELSGMTLDHFASYLHSSLSKTIEGFCVVQSPLPFKIADLLQVVPNASAPLLAEMWTHPPTESTYVRRRIAALALPTWP